jgi:hypothetical protein
LPVVPAPVVELALLVIAGEITAKGPPPRGWSVVAPHFRRLGLAAARLFRPALAVGFDDAQIRGRWSTTRHPDPERYGEEAREQA